MTEKVPGTGGFSRDRVDTSAEDVGNDGHGEERLTRGWPGVRPCWRWAVIGGLGSFSVESEMDLFRGDSGEGGKGEVATA